MNKPIVFIVFISFMLASLDSNAASIRCGSKTFSSTTRASQLQSAVLKACGEPTERKGEVWIYKKKGKMLKFIDGKLKDVTNIKKR